MVSSYDVIIIGAGPAGLECARGLKNKNLSVLLLEKNKVIGPKICGGGLSNLNESLDIPKNKIKVFAKQKIFLDDSCYNINLEYPLKVISRLDLGQYQLKKIKDSKNIEILKSTIVEKIEKNKIITNKGVFYFKYLIGADGSNSIVRKYLGLKSKFCFCYYYDTQKITKDIVWYFNLEFLKLGYIAEFPHKKFTRIGIYFDLNNLNPRKAKMILDNYLLKKKYFSIKNSFKGAPINYFYDGCVFNNIYLIGDAAGLASKNTGEGISFARISGREISKKILNEKYNLCDLKKILKIKKRQENIFRLMNFLPFKKLFLKIFINFFKFGWFQSFFGI